MDKYQEFLLKSINCHIFSSDEAELKINDSGLFGDKIIIKQLDDIMLKKYLVHLRSESIFKIYSITNQDKIEWDEEIDPRFTLKNGGAYFTEVNFDDKIQSIEICFKEDVVDPLLLSVEFVEADKEKYYQKQAELKRLDLIKSMNISHSCGQDLVNIKFQLVNENVKSVVIDLFDKDKNIMGSFKVEEGMFFKAITNLAYGSYFYKVKQFDEQKNLIIDSDFVAFSINKPNYSGRPTWNIN